LGGGWYITFDGVLDTGWLCVTDAVDKGDRIPVLKPETFVVFVIEETEGVVVSLTLRPANKDELVVEEFASCC